jgi:hypothetical protein
MGTVNFAQPFQVTCTKIRGRPPADVVTVPFQLLSKIIIKKEQFKKEKLVHQRVPQKHLLIMRNDLQ